MGSGEDVSDYDCGSERVDDVFVVGVEEEPVVDVACIGGGAPEKPITALICNSFSILQVIFLNIISRRYDL